MRPLPDLFAECDRHFLALHEAMGRCPQPLAANHFLPRDPQLVAAIDQFAYRFARLQDVMGRNCFDVLRWTYWPSQSRTRRFWIC